MNYSSALNELRDSSEPMWIFDQKTLSILEVNDAALMQYGYTRTEFLSRTILDIRPTKDIQDFLRSNYQSPHATETSTLWRHQAKTGEIFWVEVTSRELLWEGRPVEMVRAVPRSHIDKARPATLWDAV